MAKLYPVIMCGGAGSRLWPVSRPATPKQFISLHQAESCFTSTVRRFAPLEGAHTPLVVAGLNHRAAVEDALEAAGAHANLILEPEARDSAPAMAAAAAWIHERDPEGVAVFVASDHHIPDDEAFRRAVEAAAVAAGAGLIVTLGVLPTTPSSAYGYIQPAEPVAGALRVSRFVEKPSAEVAAGYVAEGYLWNSGNFIVQAATLLGELDRFAPEVSRAARQAVRQGRWREGGLELSPAFRAAPRISIDYAVMERTSRAAVLPVSFAWSDLGAWDAVWQVSARDGAGNAVMGRAALIESQGCYVRAGSGMMVATLGARDLAIVAEPDAVLVLDLARSQDVKRVVEQLKSMQAAEVEAPARTPLRFPPALTDASAHFSLWLKTSALPVWASLGFDHARGCFEESLSPVAEPTGEPRRARAQARQIYAFATAGAMGWQGPWRPACVLGLQRLDAVYQRPDGLFSALAAADGSILDGGARLYDQAFVLLALAALHAADVDREVQADRAEALFQLIERSTESLGGGQAFGPEAFLSNPHMHLFEACLAWMDAEGGASWAARAERLAQLCLARFIDPESGAVREAFDPCWSARAGTPLEPGHQFEWAWLLERWGRGQGDADASAAAHRLYEAGSLGVDPRRSVAVDGWTPSSRNRDGAARLWPQTERLKAALLFSETASDEHRAGYVVDALDASGALDGYLRTPVPGLWWDSLGADGRFASTPSPASSLYHLVGAVAQLRHTVEGLIETDRRSALHAHDPVHGHHVVVQVGHDP